MQKSFDVEKLDKKIKEQGITRGITHRCLPETIKFLDALNRQKEGIVMVRHSNNVTNYEGTLAKITSHFNEIWKEYITALNPLQLQSDPSEKKLFLKFNNSTSNYECMVVTMGVGTTVQAEMELRHVYPECKFLAADPDSAINQDLVENKLKGTFVKRAIAAEDSYTSQIKPNLIGNVTIDELPIGFFDFFLYYNAITVIDLLTIDLEGTEFAILQLLAEQYNQLPITLCQMNIEVHHNPINANSFLRHRFFRNFDSFIRNGKFVLMKTEMYEPLQYHRMFFVNFVDKICVEKFLC